MPAPAHPLAAGTQLENYRIQRLLATGGFSRVYLAHDENDVPVAIKEYRIAEDDRAKFLHGMRCFFAQLLNGLREVHTGKLLHLDIKPANIYLRNDASPLLLDFGAARYALSGEGMKLPPTYTPGYASPEQHLWRDLLGPWSDIYSVGATMYATLAGGQPPLAANLRVDKDDYVPARVACGAKYSAELLELVDGCLRLDHLERPQSVLALQKALRDDKEPEPRGDEPVLGQIWGAVLKFKGNLF
jgi:serine/threonine protein kinase